MSEVQQRRALPEQLSDPRELWHELLDRALTAPGNLHGAYNRFYDYSFGNCLLLYIQGAEGPVATYKRWQDMGRQVVKGAKAMEILRPITIKKTGADGQVELGEDGKPKVFTKFKLVRAVFDYKDTTGEELPPIEVPEWSLDKALEKLEIERVPFHNYLSLLDGNTAGYSYERKIALNPAAPYPFKTQLHEISHIINGHTSEENQGQYTAHRGLWEFEAEGSAHLVGHELGVESEEEADVSRAYIQHWLGGERPPESSIRKVFTTADAILKAGRLSVAAETEAV